jgi:hypothetical protein
VKYISGASGPDIRIIAHDPGIGKIFYEVKLDTNGFFFGANIKPRTPLVQPLLT